MTIKIEKGIKIPAVSCGRSLGEFGKALRAMKVGDSVVVKKNPKNIYSAARYAKIKVSVRSLDGSGALRVWRVK